jgi:putative hydrolase of the HAD superfamily
VIFDAFGTIVHPEPGWEALRPECLAVVHGTWTGRHVPLPQFLAAYEAARADQHAALDGGWREFDFPARFRHALVRCGVPPAEAEPWGPVASERYHRFQQALVHAYDQAAKVLPDLRADGYRLALVSNYNHGGVLREALARLDLLPSFDAVVVSGEVGVLKPHPRIFRAATDALGVAPHEAVMVGNDVDADVRGAKEAGLRAVWTPYPREAPRAPAPPEADAVAEHLIDLPAILRRLE